MDAINFIGTDVDIFSGAGSLFLQVKKGEDIIASIMVEGSDVSTKGSLQDKANLIEAALEKVASK